MHVRRACPADAPAITGLYRELVPGDPNVHVDPVRVAELQEHPDNILLGIEHESCVRGTAFLTICLDAMYRSQPFCLLENIVIESSVRRTGLGQSLCNEVARIARARGCTKVMLLSSAARVDAHAFFSAVGFDGAKKKAFVQYLNRP